MTHIPCDEKVYITVWTVSDKNEKNESQVHACIQSTDIDSRAAVGEAN